MSLQKIERQLATIELLELDLFLDKIDVLIQLIPFKTNPTVAYVYHSTFTYDPFIGVKTWVSTQRTNGEIETTLNIKSWKLGTSETKSIDINKKEEISAAIYNALIEMKTDIKGLIEFKETAFINQYKQDWREERA